MIDDEAINPEKSKFATVVAFGDTTTTSFIPKTDLVPCLPTIFIWYEPTGRFSMTVEISPLFDSPVAGNVIPSGASPNGLIVPVMSTVFLKSPAFHFTLILILPFSGLL